MYIFIRLLGGVELINNIDPDKFSTLLDYVYENLKPNVFQKELSDNNKEISLEDLEKLIGIDNAAFIYLIKTSSYILKRSLVFVQKPTKLHSALKEKLNICDANVECFVKLWIRATKPILNNLESPTVGTKEMTNVAWKLKVELSSDKQLKQKYALGELQIFKNDENTINLEMNHEELYNFYNQMENIQLELDNLKKISQ